jgi:hypothetical protein
MTRALNVVGSNSGDYSIGVLTRWAKERPTSFERLSLRRGATVAHQTARSSSEPPPNGARGSLSRATIWIVEKRRPRAASKLLLLESLRWQRSGVDRL